MRCAARSSRLLEHSGRRGGQRKNLRVSVQFKLDPSGANLRAAPEIILRRGQQRSERAAAEAARRAVISDVRPTTFPLTNTRPGPT